MASSETLLNKFDINKIIMIAKGAGDRIMEIYDNGDIHVNYKEDSSPVTLADKASHDFIVGRLKKLYPEIPILSEEDVVPYEVRKDWDIFWLVDPLDGTKEFIKRNGEFTVNIALICSNLPVLGVIYAPSKGTIYFAKKGLGAYKLDAVSTMTVTTDIDSILRVSKRLPLRHTERHFTVIASRSHLSKETEEYINKLRDGHQEIGIINAGSSLKLCMIAEGLADVYPRLAPTMEWDIAAGHMIIEEAGGEVLDTRIDNKPLEYNKKDLLNPSFIGCLKHSLIKN